MYNFHDYQKTENDRRAARGKGKDDWDVENAIVGEGSQAPKSNNLPKRQRSISNNVWREVTEISGRSRVYSKIKPITNIIFYRKGRRTATHEFGSVHVGNPRAMIVGIQA